MAPSNLEEWTMSRRSELAETPVLELVSMLIHEQWQTEQLRRENASLREALSRAQCGDLGVGPATSCQLPRDHDGLHANEDPKGLVVRWR